MSRVNHVYNLDGQRAYVAIQDHTLPASEGLPSLRDLQQWLEARLPEA